MNWLRISKELGQGGLAVTLGGIITLAAVFPDRSLAESVLTVDQARQRARQFNRAYLSAQEEVVRARSEIVKARSGALPEITATGSYSRNFILPSFFAQTKEGILEFQTGFKNSFAAMVDIRQSLWQGGKVFTALAVAKLYEQFSEAQRRAVEASVEYNTDVLFYSAIRARSQLAALEKEYEFASHSVEVVNQKHVQGLVSQFEVLRAAVEKRNLEPALLKAQSDLRLAEKQLKSFLGIDLSEPVLLVEPVDDTSPADLPALTALSDTALALRPEMRGSELLSEITRKAIRVAKGEFLPSFEAVSSYRWESVSDDFTLKDNVIESWTAGLTLSIPIFQGGARIGDLRRRRSEHYQARLDAAQTRDEIKLEVEEAYDRVQQATEAWQVQRQTIALAEEGLRIANLRYESGMGTLLEVLSAQTALTEARNIEAESLFLLRTARSRLKKATGIDF